MHLNVVILALICFALLLHDFMIIVLSDQENQKLLCGLSFHQFDVLVMHGPMLMFKPVMFTVGLQIWDG